MKILGQNVTDDTRKEIAGALAGLEPAIDVTVNYVDVPDRPGCQIIVMYFNPFVWGTVPYTYRGCPYYKRESTTVVMPREMFEERLRASNPNFYSWERMPADGISIEDLNENRIRGTVKLGVESGRIPASALAEPLGLLLDKMDLLTDGKPNNAAAVLFGTKVKSYPQFSLRMARFRGCDKMEFIDNQRVDGNFFDLLDAGMSFFLKHLNMSGKIVGFTRQESLEIPATALREALTNALCHRQWEKHNLTIGISIYDDRIEIENPGKFPPQLNPENIKEPHLSYPYNPIMAKVLFQTTFLESWGSGVNRIVETCRSIGIPEPMWEEKMGFIVLIFNELTDNTPEVPPKYPLSMFLRRGKYIDCWML